MSASNEADVLTKLCTTVDINLRTLTCYCTDRWESLSQGSHDTSITRKLGTLTSRAGFLFLREGWWDSELIFF